MTKQSEKTICYTTIFDEHVIKNLVTIYGKEKAISIILEGKKHDNKFQIIDRFKQLVCHFDFHPEKGLLMKAYDFKNNLDSKKYNKYITDIKKNPSDKTIIKLIPPEEFFFSKLK